MQIVNRTPALPERGKIKIGEKGKPRTSSGGKTFQPPQKLDHFIITTLERGADGNFLHDTQLMQTIAEKTGQEPDKLTRIPVRLLYNDPELNFATQYGVYAGRTLWCSGNGREAMRQAPDKEGTYVGVSCPCERIEKGFEGPGPKCKINGILSVLVDHAAGVGGVWKFRTTSFNSVDGLMGSLSFMAAATGGWLANLPLELVLHKKLVADPKGNQQTIYVVGLEWRGTVDALRDDGYRAALAAQQANLRIEHIETEARKLLDGATPNTVFPGEDADDVVDEFYPEDEQNGAAPDLVPPGDEGPADGEAAPEEPAPKKGRGRPRKADAESAPEEAPVEVQAAQEPPPGDDDAPPPEVTPPAAQPKPGPAIEVDEDPIF